MSEFGSRYEAIEDMNRYFQKYRDIVNMSDTLKIYGIESKKFDELKSDFIGMEHDDNELGRNNKFYSAMELAERLIREKYGNRK